ncbi:hypothetical protein QZJ86_00445 [Methylomonas montana]|uniref:hypothetical protein n=1 Tax=Methylomonas montana TaxID=3058963 RepID=UPI002658F0B3|nr:hypothetical protein [Methylomonas montana]WKJ90635.1 hypothetical protein QZJ86_00445 [Methylomonas montana]
MKLRFLLAALLLLSCRQTFAALVGIHFAGVINQAEDSTLAVYKDPSAAWLLELQSKFQIGTAVSGNFYYDSEALPVSSDVEGGDTENVYPITSVDLSSNGFTGHANGGELSIIDGFYGNFDQYVVWADIDNDISSSGTIAPLYSAGLSIVDDTELLFSNGNLPLLPPDITLYPERHISLMFVKDVNNPDQGKFAINATLASLEVVAVPIPAALWLFGSGLCGLLLTGRRTLGFKFMKQVA